MEDGQWKYNKGIWMGGLVRAVEIKTEAGIFTKPGKQLCQLEEVKM